MELKLINNKGLERYEYIIDEHIALIDYKIAKGKIYLIHTEVPLELQGRGIGTKLVADVLFDIRNNTKHKLVPLCPFVVAYLGKHPELVEMLPKLV